MKNGSFAAAALVVVVANGFALLHAARNRMGQPNATITLTERELSRVPTDDNSGVALMLNFQYPNGTWLSREKLSSLGFDCGVEPARSGARDFYERQVPRSAFVALEYNGPAYRTAALQGNAFSRLVAIDAATEAAQLRARYPDRHSVLILPAAIRIAFSDAVSRKDRKARIVGFIDNVPRSIHVPQPFSSKLQTSPITHPPPYRVNVTFGSALDPWVTGVITGVITGVEPEASETGRPRQ